MKTLPRVVVALLVLIAVLSGTNAQAPSSDPAPPADPPLGKFASSLVGKWFTFGDRNKVSYIASAGSKLLTINDVKDTLELTCGEEGSLTAQRPDYQTSGVVSGNFILWSNGTWWSRFPVAFGVPKSEPVSSRPFIGNTAFDPRWNVRRPDDRVVSNQVVDGALTVLSASYGTDNKFADVTDTVVRLLKDGGRHHANPGELKADPNPGWNKALVIIYTLHGERFIESVVENNPFSRERLKNRNLVTQ